MLSFRKRHGMLSFRARIAAAVGAVLLAAIFALPASAASAQASAPALSGHHASASVIPKTGSATNCNPNPLLPVSECTTVIGSGLKIKSLSGYAVNNLGIPINDVHIELYGPRGKIKRCGDFNLAPFGVGPVCTWHNPHPNKKVRKGNYCSRAIEITSDLSNECIPVHR
jgi:hypothetical protein